MSTGGGGGGRGTEKVGGRGEATVKVDPPSQAAPTVPAPAPASAPASRPPEAAGRPPMIPPLSFGQRPAADSDDGEVWIRPSTLWTHLDVRDGNKACTCSWGGSKNIGPGRGASQFFHPFSRFALPVAGVSAPPPLQRRLDPVPAGIASAPAGVSAFPALPGKTAAPLAVPTQLPPKAGTAFVMMQGSQ